MDLEQLQVSAATCTLCELHKGRINPVFAKGNPKAPIMICGMVPAYEENKQGIPFVGRAGQLLDRILQTVQISDVYITNLVKCFLAPGKPLQPEWINSCLPYLISQIGLVEPHVIITLGADATNGLLGTPGTAIGKMRDKVHDWSRRIKVVPTYHPSYLLRKGGEFSNDFAKVIGDFTLARNTLSSILSDIYDSNGPVFYSSE